jgi:drug/metabolite transporter (DMT)-like permease
MAALAADSHTYPRPKEIRPVGNDIIPKRGMFPVSQTVCSFFLGIMKGEPTDDGVARSKKTATAHVCGPALFMLAVPLFWGSTFLLTDLAMQSAGKSIKPTVMALYVTFMRCAVATVALGLYSPLGIAKVQAWRMGAMIGLPVCGATLLQTFAIELAEPDTVAFLICLSLPFTSLLMIAVNKQCLSLGMWGSIALTAAGAVLIEGLPSKASFGPGFALGILAALVFASADITRDWVKSDVVSATEITLVQMAFQTFMCLLAMVLVIVTTDSSEHNLKLVGELGNLLRNNDFMVPVVLMSILATACTELVMNKFQHEIGAVRAALIYSLEPVVAFALQRCYETVQRQSHAVDGWQLVGMSLIIVGVLIGNLHTACGSEAGVQATPKSREMCEAPQHPMQPGDILDSLRTATSDML